MIEALPRGSTLVYASAHGEMRRCGVYQDDRPLATRPREGRRERRPACPMGKGTASSESDRARARSTRRRLSEKRGTQATRSVHRRRTQDSPISRVTPWDTRERSTVREVGIRTLA
jgi:hypothetical protein